MSNKRTAIVFGSNGSIGKAIISHLAGCGIQTIGVGRSSSSSTVGIYHQCDLRQEKEVMELAKKVQAGSANIDYLVLCQGTQLRKPLVEFTSEEWNNILSTNLNSNFYICKYFVPGLIRTNFGRIIGISSLTSQIGIRNIAAYAASKGGFEQMLKTLAVELSAYNITVNTINPGRIATDMTTDITGNADSNTSMISRIPQGRFGKPEDLLSAVDFLLADSSSYITGQSIIVDGGWMASGGNPRT